MVDCCASGKDGGLALTTKGIDTKQILEGRDVEIEIDEEEAE